MMKKLLIGICLLVGCGDPVATGLADDWGCSRPDPPNPARCAPLDSVPADDVDECVEDADCGAGLVCLTYQRRCIPEPRLCESDEVLVHLDQAVIRDRNAVLYPHSAVDPIEVFTDGGVETTLRGNKGHPITLGGWHHIMLEGGDPLHVNLTFHVVNFEIGEFEVDLGGEFDVSFDFECVFTLAELIEGAGEVVCEQEQGYVLTLTYDADPVVCE